MRTHNFAASLVLLALASGCKGGARPVPQDETASCVRCHGGYDGSEPARTGLALAAPPRSTTNTTETSDPRVGAHRQHLVDGRIRQAIECRECHVVPTQVEGHIGDSGTGHATITFGGDLGRAQGTVPQYDPNAANGPTCSNVYCHGATLGGGASTSPVWTRVNGNQILCTSCHGYPPSSHASFPSRFACKTCHPGTLLDDSTIDVAGGLHINGRKDAAGGGSGCALCHGFPPADGVHAIHVNPATQSGTYGELRSGAGATASSYYFGCGECHPTDTTRHMSGGKAEVVLAPPNPPVAGDEIKRRNDPAAAYDDASGTCSGVYCHSSGQETPVYVTTPNWRNPPAGGLGCDGCHGNPPSYANGGVGSGAENSHIYLDAPPEKVWENGHFAGVPGTWHGGSRHGGGEETISPGNGYWGANQVASPITCQACHYDTVDPTNILAGRFFYFDTTGNGDSMTSNGYPLRPYMLSGGDPARLTDPEWQASQCGFCHDDGPIAPAGIGRALPAKHVNGVRDVAFDRRTTYTGAQTGVPTLPEGSVLRPFYLTTPRTPPTHPDAQYLASTPQVLTWHLANAAPYDPVNKTCTNVACHMERQAPLVWGMPRACDGCHTSY